MKTRFILLVFLTVTPMGNILGQLGKQSLFFEGGGNFLLSSKQDNTKTINFSSKFGAFPFYDINIVGLFFDFNITTIDDELYTEFKTQTINSGIFDRVYFGTKKIRPFVELFVGEKWLTYKSFPGEGRTLNYFTYGGSGGVGYFFNEHVSLDLSVQYSIEKE
jgi:hypothetical protein